MLGTHRPGRPLTFSTDEEEEERKKCATKGKRESFSY